MANTVRNPEPYEQEVAEHPDTYNKGIEPIPVRIVADKSEPPETIKAATSGSWESFRFAGTAADVPVMILRQDSRRKRAEIQGLPGFVSNNTSGNMWIGSRAQIMNGNPGAANACIFVSGMKITVESEEAVYAMSDGAHELTLSVHDEIYRT